MSAVTWTYLHRMDGTVISSTGCYWPPGGRWNWIAETYAAEHGCSADDVSVIETEDGDRITVKGAVVGYAVNELNRADFASAIGG